MFNVIVIRKNHINLAPVLDLGFSDIYAQILCINVERQKSGLVKVKKRRFTEEHVEEFKYLLLKELWIFIILV
jgi:hypothetical protein